MKSRAAHFMNTPSRDQRQQVAGLAPLHMACPFTAVVPGSGLGPRS
jgi:hypothetical protein